MAKARGIRAGFSVRLIVRSLRTYRGHLPVLNGVDLEVGQGETVAILGANGAGKSTLLGSVMGLHPPRSGEVLLEGYPLAGLPPEEIVKYGISLVPERRQIFGPLTVRQNLFLGAYHRYRRDKSRLGREVEGVLELFPALRPYLDSRAGNLSGGEQQMVAIGRGLLANPKVLLLDEPSLGLAPLVREEIFRALDRLAEEGRTVVLVEQNLRLTPRRLDRVYLLEKGRVAFTGRPEELAARGEGYL